MEVYDISMKVYYDMPVYKGKEAKRPQIEVQSDFATSSCYESKIHMNLHTGTHLDSSLHMIEGGKTMEALDLRKVVTKCQVLDLKNLDEKVTKEDLEKKEIQKGDFVLLKTKNSFEDILEGDFIYLDKTGASYLKEVGVIGVGIDALGIERAQPEHETHKILFHEDIVILEGLRLKDIEEGEYLLVAPPINIIGVEGSPTRAILIRQ
jgi:arylformamidase